MTTSTEHIKTREVMCGKSKVKSHKRRGKQVRAHTRKTKKKYLRGTKND